MTWERRTLIKFRFDGGVGRQGLGRELRAQSCEAS